MGMMKGKAGIKIEKNARWCTLTCEVKPIKNDTVPLRNRTGISLFCPQVQWNEGDVSWAWEMLQDMMGEKTKHIQQEIPPLTWVFASGFPLLNCQLS